jgi:hypothetical protein
MNGFVPVAVAAGVLAVVVGGVLAEAITEVLVLTGAVTGFTTGVSRYREVLRLRGSRLNAQRQSALIQRATAVGFFVGVAMSVVIAVIDALIGA